VTTLDMTSAMCGVARCRSLNDAGGDYAPIGAVAVPFEASWSPTWSSSSYTRTNFSPKLSWSDDQVGPVGLVGESAYGEEEGNSYVVVGRSRIDHKCILENSATRFGALRRADSAVRCRRMPSSAPVPRPRNTGRARERRVDRNYDLDRLPPYAGPGRSCPARRDEFKVAPTQPVASDLRSRWGQHECVGTWWDVSGCPVFIRKGFEGAMIVATLTMTGT
jgi:hypothetical protein